MKKLLTVISLAVAFGCRAAETPAATPPVPSPSPELIEAQRAEAIYKSQRDSLSIALLDANKELIDVKDKLQHAEAQLAAVKPEEKPKK